ncbi:hypothetical protein HWI79_1775 [Cryptosporidium felis]|nr:hypothetical protein HWI79_1775 [Cryptosporidium felis]
MEFSSDEFLERIIPCSEKLDSLLEENISKCVIWNDLEKVLEINQDEIMRFSETLKKAEFPKSIIVHSITLASIKRSNQQDDDSDKFKRDRRILVLFASTLQLVNSGYFDIVSWLDIVLDVSGLLKINGLVALVKWICNCFEEFNWSISNPSIPFDQKQQNCDIPESSDKNKSSESNSPSTAAQRQLAQAKFVGLLKVVNRRLVGYRRLSEAGMLRSFVFSILPSNQAGICRKAFTPRNYSWPKIDKRIEGIYEPSTSVDEEQVVSDNGTDKEEGEMTCGKEDESSDLSKDNFINILEPVKYTKNAFEAYKRVDQFFQTVSELLNSMVDNSDSLSSSKRRIIDDLSRDIDTVVSYFEDYKHIEIPYSESHSKRLVSILQGIPSSLECDYFRIHFAYRFSFVYCSQILQVLNGCMHACEYLQNKLTPLLQRCLGCVDKFHNGKRLPVIRFVNRMIQYEFLWQQWKNSNCAEINIPVEMSNSHFESARNCSEEVDIKRRRIEEINPVTKFLSDEIFNKYMDYMFNYSNSGKDDLGDSTLVKNINKPNFTTEREQLFLEPVDWDTYSRKTVDTKIFEKFRDYREKILIDSNPDNGIEESEKSVKDSLFKWRCNRLHKKFMLDSLSEFSDTQLSINDIESFINDPDYYKSNNLETKVEVEFLNIYRGASN